MQKKTAVMLVGYGGPENKDQIRPFLDHVLAGIPVPQERYEAVVHHYEQVGGSSPYKAHTYSQQKALSLWLDEQGVALEVVSGFRHSQPYYEEIFRTLKAKHYKKIIAMVLAPFRCYASYEKYIEKMTAAQKQADALDIVVQYTEGFHLHEGYLQTQAQRIREAAASIPQNEVAMTKFIFCAHSIPVPMSLQSGYADQFAECAFRSASLLSLTDWELAYQSRSGSPRDPWLEPDILEKISQIDKEAYRHVVVIPIGFLCDNVEVLYDLDIECKSACEQSGLRYHRALTAMDHPLFIDMMGQLVLEQIVDS